MKKEFTAFFLIFFCFNIFGTDTSVGKILSSQGDVMIDPFGNESFIKAIKEEKLYKTTFIKTGQDGSATIMVMDNKINVPPNAQVSVEKIITIEEKKRNTDWFKSIIKLIQQASDSLFTGEEKINLATRGDDYLNSEDIFGYETEEDIKPDYLTELGFLFDEKNTGISGYSSAELKMKKGLCFFGLSDYEDARVLFEASYKSISSNSPESGFTDKLYFMLGITNYLTGDNTKAASFLKKFIQKNEIPEIAPLAYWILIDTLIESGKSEEVTNFLENAKASLNSTRLKKMFSDYLKNKVN